MQKNITALFPIMDVEHDCIVSKHGDLTAAFSVTLPEIFSLSDSDYEAFHQTWLKALRVLPKNSVFHKQDWFVEDTFQPDLLTVNDSFFANSSNRYFNERPFLSHCGYIFITKQPKSRKATTSLSSSLLSKSIVPMEALDSKSFETLENTVGQFKLILEESGIVKLSRLTTDKIVSYAHRSGILEQYLTLSKNPISAPIQDIQFNDFIQIGKQYAQLFTLADAVNLPGTCGSQKQYDRYSTDKTRFSIGFASSVGQLLPCNHIYNQYIFMNDAAKTLRKMETKRLRLQSLASYSRQNTIALDATNAFLNEAVSNQRLPIKAHFNLLTWTQNKKQLNDLNNQVTSAFAQMEAAVKLETIGAPQIFWAGIPGNSADFPMNETFDCFAEQATCFFNLETAYQSSASPIGLRLGDRLTGKPLHVDISDEPILKGFCTNRNKFILGPSGSGKSFFTNHMLRSYYEQGSHIVLIDVGHSYQGLCNIVNGYYFTYSETNPIQFNPFYIGDGDSLNTEKKESIKTLLLALWKKDNEAYNRSEYVALSNALTSYYEDIEEKKSLRPCFDTFYDFLREQFSETLKLDRVKEKDFDISNLLYVLRPYYKGGEFDYLLNASENIDLLNERFIVFELDNIKDHPILFPVVTIIIMEVFLNKMRRLKEVRKVILIEEAWKAIAKEGMANYIKYLFKTVRKHLGEAIVVTQEVEDIISSPIIKQAIINNSDCKILLDQAKYQNKFDQIQELLGLTEKEKSLVLSINKANDPNLKYKEVFISLGGTYSRVYRTEVSLEEYLTYTTEQSEKLKVAAYAKKHGSLQAGIKILAQEIRQKTTNKSHEKTTSI